MITGPTGVGKSWLACALGHKACRDNRSVLYVRIPKPLVALALSSRYGLIASGAYLLSGAICTLVALTINKRLESQEI